MISGLRRGDVVTLVDLRTGDRPTVIVERVEEHHAIVRSTDGDDRWRVGLGFLFPLNRDERPR